MNFMDKDNMLAKESLWKYYKQNPRYISESTFHQLLNHNKEALNVSMNADDTLLLLRTLRFYSDLEKTKKYEISNVYAYEIALRTPSVKQILRDFVSGRTETSEFATLYVYHWIDANQTIKFENARYMKIEKISQGSREEELSPERTVPEIAVPVDMTEYLPIGLNMHLPKSELEALLKAYIKKLHKLRSRYEHLKDSSTLTEQYNSSIKIFRTKSKILTDLQPLRKKLKTPDTVSLKLSDMFFSYDMIELGFALADIADAIRINRVNIVTEINGNKYDKEDIASMLADIDPIKTVSKWHSSIAELIMNDQYKRFLSPKIQELNPDGYISDRTAEFIKKLYQDR